MNDFPRHSARSQSGVTLIIVMVILVIVTILGIGGAQLVLSGEQSTRYDRDAMFASQAAEAALKDAQNDLTSGVRSANFPHSNTFFGPGPCQSGAANNANSQRGLCQPPADDTNGKPNWLTVDFTNTGATATSAAIGDFTGVTFQSGLGGLVPAQAPRYIIESITDKSPSTPIPQNGAPLPKIYRITAIGFGPNPQVQSVIQVAFRHPQE